MTSIKIKHFGPIVEGYTENDGFINIDKVMIFIGGQGSGKSTVVKLISTLSWLEKALFKEAISIKDVIENGAFKDVWCEYQSIQNYFKKDSFIEYKGLFLYFRYDSGKITLKIDENASYSLPKITYIPAERNFLSVLEDLENVKGLPKSLQWTLDEYIRACRSQKSPIPIGINEILFEYDRDKKETFIKGKNFDALRLSEASSGIQSVVPMINVMYYLEFFINNKKINSIENLSFSERERYEKLEELLLIKDKKNKNSKEGLFEILKGKVLPQHLFTIVEEIEQNLFPESQREILINALNRVNNKLENHLILTTHSPYIIAYTTLAMKAYNVKKLTDNESILKKIDNVIPLTSTIDSSQTGVYQINDEGQIISLISKSGLILDNNYLNNSLEDTNELFNELLDLEDLCK